MATYPIGRRIRITWSVYDLDGVLADTTAVIKIEDPSGNENSSAFTNDATGLYHHDLTLDEAGIWIIRAEGTGAVVTAAKDITITVESTRLT